MSRQKWAAIVYGRSYHLDFRFITIPHDFTEQDVAWASQHILATTHQARNLSSHPRWSLFKNDVYCVAGVTCMVRDLIKQVDDQDENSVEAKTRDDQGRPLYIFVGYATSLNQEQTLLDIPNYTELDLASFEPLYQQVERVWLVKDYEANSKYPLLSQYESWDYFVDLASLDSGTNYTSQLNHQAKYPDKIFLWSSSPEQNHQLWTASAQCSESTSVCINIKDKFLANSPFVNQSVSSLEKFTIKQRVISGSKTNSISESISQPQSLNNPNSQLNSSLTQKISTRAKEDLDLTLQQAAKVTAASQELINNFTDWSNSNKKAEGKYSDPQNNEDEFGFKTKKSSPTSQSQEEDWF
ncbi:MAG: hypothetical protein ACRC80_12365 [Waterburya sp.]